MKRSAVGGKRERVGLVQRMTLRKSAAVSWNVKIYHHGSEGKGSTRATEGKALLLPVAIYLKRDLKVERRERRIGE